MRADAKAWNMPTRPIRLKHRLKEAGKTQAMLANKIQVPGKKAIGMSRSLLCQICNTGYMPPDIPDFREQVEAVLDDMGVATTGIWEFEKDGGRKGWNGRPKNTYSGACAAKAESTAKGGGEDMNVTREYLEEEEIRHFGLDGDPFYELADFSDIYVSPQLKVVVRRVHDTIKRHGIMAIVGDVGAGKSTLLRHILTGLMKDNKVSIIVPDDMDREKLTGRGLTAAIITALGGGHAPRAAVDRDRLAKRLLEDSIKSGANPVLIIDEAHDLNDQVIIALKRIWDSGLIFKLISIIIVGQGGVDDKGHSWGLKSALEHNPFIREFAERCYVADIGVMNGSMGDYLGYRFKKAGGDAKRVFDTGALRLLSERAGVPNRAHNVAVRAMRAAYRDGKTTVTSEHVNDA